MCTCNLNALIYTKFLSARWTTVLITVRTCYICAFRTGEFSTFRDFWADEISTFRPVWAGEILTCRPLWASEIHTWFAYYIFTF